MTEEKRKKKRGLKEKKVEWNCGSWLRTQVQPREIKETIALRSKIEKNTEKIAILLFTFP